MKNFKEKLSGRVFLILALSSISALALITGFIFVSGLPVIGKVFGMNWAPTQGEYGILPMIIGSVSVTFGAAIIGIPIGICCAVFMAELAPERMRNLFRPAIQLLAAIPSVV